MPALVLVPALEMNEVQSIYLYVLKVIILRLRLFWFGFLKQYSKKNTTVISFLKFLKPFLSRENNFSCFNFSC